MLMVLFVWSSAMNLTLLTIMIGCTQAAPATSKKPNFVVLFVDDMGIAQIDVPKPAGIYGYSGDGGNISTPNLAKFASEVRTSSAGVHTDNVRVHSWHIPHPLARDGAGACLGKTAHLGHRHALERGGGRRGQISEVSS
mgnify:CR=1 FL=1